MSEFHTLQWNQVSAEQCLSVAKPKPPLLDWHQSATHVIERVESSQLLMLPMSLGVVEAEKILNQSERRYAMVVDAEQQIVGVILTREIHGRQSHVIANLLQVSWQELTVGYLMTPIQRLPAISLQQTMAAKIGDIAATIQDAGSDFLLIMNETELYGVVVSLKILAVTGESVRLYPKATSFADVFNVIKHSER